MKAMIFAAGLGTRLKPVTDTIPKALVPVNGKPLLEHIILKIRDAGFEEIMVNVHHFPDQIIDFIERNKQFGIRIAISDERQNLLETGGGIKKARWFFDDDQPFLVHNVDILSNLDLKELYSNHLSKKALATLTVSERNTFRYFMFDKSMSLEGWINEKTGETKPSGFTPDSQHIKLAFSGIQVLSPEVFEWMNHEDDKFSITDFYLKHASSGKIKGFVPENYQMLDIGKIDILDTANDFLKHL